MSIRPSGGRLVVEVTEDTKEYPPESVRAYLNRRFGAFRWSIPEPKGHPEKPGFWTMFGRAMTYEEALEKGRERLREVYGKDPE
jgi:hypothetical protein